jgi:hypothetical protein
VGVSRRCRAILNSFHSLNDRGLSASNPATVPFNSFQPVSKSSKLRNSEAARCRLSHTDKSRAGVSVLSTIVRLPAARA